MSDAQIDDREELGHAPGLSSAMHDIRMIARRYQDDSAQRASHQGLELGGVSMNPSFLLVPNATSRGESWKGVALVMMVLLGLSTSALALTLYAAADEASMESAPLLMELDATAPGLSAQAVPEIVMAPEPAIYSVSSLPGTTARPQVRDSRAPVSSKLEMRQASVGAFRTSAEPAKSCDEVACLLDGSDACCQAYESVRAHEAVLDDAPSRPYRPTRSDIMVPMSSIHGRVTACSSTYEFKGVASVGVVISPAGTVSRVALDDGSPAFQACVQAHVFGLTFPELSQPFTFSYPFTF